MRITPIGCFLLLGLSVCTCGKRSDPGAAFLHQYGRADFSPFANTALFVRGFDHGEALVFFYKPPTRCFAVYRYDMAHRRARFGKFVPLQGGCQTFTPADSALVGRFMRLGVSYLEVDRQGTVYITIQQAMPHIELVKTQNLSQTRVPRQPYFEKGGDWFEHRTD